MFSQNNSACSFGWCRIRMIFQGSMPSCKSGKWVCHEMNSEPGCCRNVTKNHLHSLRQNCPAKTWEWGQILEIKVGMKGHARSWLVWVMLLETGFLNSLWLRDFIWWHRSGSAWTPRHYLNPCWLIVKGVLWHVPKSYINTKCSWT